MGPPENSHYLSLDETGLIVQNYCWLVSMRAEYECIFITLQISSEEILTKKEQLSEALQTMQLFLAKHGDKYVGFHECFFNVGKWS